MNALSTEQVWELLAEVKDPEIPAVSLVEMGIVRGVSVEAGRVQVRLTPTFQGCPALQMMQKEVEQRLLAAGVPEVEISIVHHPPWTSEWITPEGRQKLKAFGLAPPPRHQGDFETALLAITTCPYCGSQDTSLKNSFGSTLCRMIFYCNDCRQPFEQFKPL